jgi:hypothetical protein
VTKTEREIVKLCVVQLLLMKHNLYWDVFYFTYIWCRLDMTRKWMKTLRLLFGLYPILCFSFRSHTYTHTHTQVTALFIVGIFLALNRTHSKERENYCEREAKLSYQSLLRIHLLLLLLTHLLFACAFICEFKARRCCFMGCERTGE